MPTAIENTDAARKPAPCAIPAQRAGSSAASGIDS